MGCHIQKHLSCLNGGTCLSNGLCACGFGYSGLTCSDKFPIGTIVPISSNNVLNFFDSAGKGLQEYRGWYLCDGQNGRPDLKGKVLVGYSKNDNDYNMIGKNGGLSHVSLTVEQLPDHDHEDSGHKHNISIETSNSGLHYHQSIYCIAKGKDGYVGKILFAETITCREFINTWSRSSTDGSHNHKIYGNTNQEKAKISKTGGNQKHENRPPYYVLVYMIFLNI